MQTFTEMGTEWMENAAAVIHEKGQKMKSFRARAPVNNRPLGVLDMPPTSPVYSLTLKRVQVFPRQRNTFLLFDIVSNQVSFKEYSRESWVVGNEKCREYCTDTWKPYLSTVTKWLYFVISHRYRDMIYTDVVYKCCQPFPPYYCRDSFYKIIGACQYPQQALLGNVHWQGARAPED